MHDEQKKTCILLADDTPAIDLLRGALSKYIVYEATTMLQAQRWIDENGIDVFVIGVHFDDSSSIQLINTIRIGVHHKDCPIVVIRMLPSEQTKILQQTFSSMIKLGVIDNYFEATGDREFDFVTLQSLIEKAATARCHSS